jgi:hypothetical protein
MTASAPSPRLYPQLLGAAWASLAPVVQRVHAAPAETYAEGTAQVSRATGRLLGYVLDAAGVPRSSCTSAVCLAVWHRGTAERWHREFGGRPLVTHQSEAPGNLLAERIGVLEFRFRLLAQDGALLFRQEALALRLGALRIPLPGCISPIVAAREGSAVAPDGDENRTSVDVRVTLPTGALLFAYRGTVRWRLRGSDGQAGSRLAGRAAP